MRRFRSQRTTSASGYSLVELLAITAMLMFLSLFAVPVYDYLTDRARLSTSLQDLRVIEEALEAYYTDNGHYPDRLQRLTKEGYLHPTFSFKSPWNSGKKTRYYFYTVDQAGEPRAYLLGDPGPNTDANNCRQEGPVTLYASNKHLLPCGRNPKDPAWIFADSNDLRLNPAPEQTVRSLSGFRQPCDPRRETDMTIAPGCVVKTES